MFINIQTGDAYVSAEKKTVYKMDGKPHTVYLLTREDGSTKEVSETAFKAWFQEDHEAENRDKGVTTEKVYTDEMIPMPGTEDPNWGKKAAGKAKKPQLTAHQKTAKEQLTHAYNWIVGGHENSLQDGHVEALPPVEELFEEVLEEATTHLYGEGMCSQKPAPAAMNFAGKKFIIETLVKLFEKDGYEVPESCKKVPEKKKAAQREYKDTPDSVGEDEVVMRAFTGMLIGVFKIVKKTKTYISVETARGQSLKFDKKTGIQMDAKNPKFANRIEV